MDLQGHPVSKLSFFFSGLIPHGWILSRLQHLSVASTAQTQHRSIPAAFLSFLVYFFELFHLDGWHAIAAQSCQSQQGRTQGAWLFFQSLRSFYPAWEFCPHRRLTRTATLDAQLLPPIQNRHRRSLSAKVLLYSWWSHVFQHFMCPIVNICRNWGTVRPRGFFQEYQNSTAFRAGICCLQVHKPQKDRQNCLLGVIKVP